MVAYAELVTRLQNYTEDPDSEFSDEIDTIIENAELRIARDLEVDGFDAMTEREDGSMSTGDREITKPSAVISTVQFNIVNGTTRPVLQKRPESFLNYFWPDRTATDVPRYYADLDETKWVVAPTPDDTYTYEIETKQRITGLSSGTTTTWISTQHPDLLFFACLVEGEIFHTNPDDLTLYEARYQQALEGVNRESIRNRMDGASSRS